MHDGLSVYKNALNELALSMMYAEKVCAGSRKARKLRCKFNLLSSYINMAGIAIPILNQYHESPLQIVNQFWASLDHFTIITAGRFPTSADFFEWYCDSKTIQQEYSLK